MQCKHCGAEVGSEFVFALIAELSLNTQHKTTAEVNQQLLFRIL